jgi:hypothetical protein
MLKSFAIEDDLEAQTSRGIEVSVVLEDGRRRWCYFMTPEALKTCGDWLDEAKTCFHYGAPHMIVIAGKIDRKTIEQALSYIDKRGELEKCTLPISE